MLPTTNPNANSNNSSVRGSSVECLLCYGEFIAKHTAKSPSEAEILSDLFSVFSKYMNWESREEYQFNFNDEEFPFCPSCSLSLVHVYKLNEQLVGTIASVSAKIIKSWGRVKEASSNNGEGAINKTQFYRRQTITQYVPTFHRKDQGQDFAAEENLGSEKPSTLSEDNWRLQSIDESSCIIPSSPTAPLIVLVQCSNSSQQVSQTITSRESDKAPAMMNKDFRSRCSSCNALFSTVTELAIHWSESNCSAKDLSKELQRMAPLTTETQALKAVVTAEYEESPRSSKEKFPCHLCRGSFKNLNRHFMNVHSASTTQEYKRFQFQCTECSRSFATESRLIQHVKAHESVECDICGETYSAKTIVSHKYFQHDYELCRICNKYFTFASLNEHRRSHCEVRGQKGLSGSEAAVNSDNTSK